jgi:hypothetical protein
MDDQSIKGEKGEDRDRETEERDMISELINTTQKVIEREDRHRSSKR